MSARFSGTPTPGTTSAKPAVSAYIAFVLAVSSIRSSKSGSRSGAR